MFKNNQEKIGDILPLKVFVIRTT